MISPTRPIADSPHRRIWPETSLIIFILLSCLVLGGISGVLHGKDISWDFRNYHVYNAYAFLNGRMGFDIGLGQLQTYLNPLLDVPPYLLFRYGPLKSTGFFLGALHGLNAGLLFLICFVVLVRLKPWIRYVSTMVCTWTGILGVNGQAEWGMWFHDLVVSLFINAALLVILYGIIRERTDGDAMSLSRVLIAGLIAGAGAGLKLTLAPYCCGLLAAWIWISWGTPKWIRKDLILGAAMGCGLLLTNGFWMIKLWILYGNPVFPFYNRFFQSPYYDVLNFTDDRFFPKTALQQWFYPFCFTSNLNSISEQPLQDYRYAALYILMGVSAVMIVIGLLVSLISRRRIHIVNSNHISPRGVVSFFVIYAVISYVLWQKMFSVFRYLTPLEHIIPLMIFLLLGGILRKPIMDLVVTTIVCSLLLMTMVIPKLGVVPWEGVPGQKEYLNVEMPGFNYSNNMLVVVVVNDPIAILALWFPESTRFVHPFSNFLIWHRDNKLIKDIKQVIYDHHGDIFVLAHQKRGMGWDRIRKELGLTVRRELCREIRTGFQSGLILCPADRVQTP